MRLPSTRARALAPSLLSIFAALALLSSSCGNPVPDLVVTAPAHGIFTTAASVTVTGRVDNVTPGDFEVTLNGAPVVVAADRTFSVDVPLVAADVLNPILVELRVPSTNFRDVERRVVVAGLSVPDGMYSPDSIGMRINDTGLDQMEPTIQSLVGGDLDINGIVLAANPIVRNYCIGYLFGLCLGRVDVNATSASFTSFGLNLDAQNTYTTTAITVNNLRVNYHVSGAVSCDGRIQTNATTITGNYDQQPGNPTSTVDVNQLGDVAVGFSGFSNSFTSGVCDFPLIGDIIQLIIGDVQPLVHDGFVAGLRDPDGSGAQDAPIAGAIQSTLAGLKIAGPIGEGLGVALDADFDAIAEDTAGLTYHVDARITQPTPTAGSPDLSASYHVPQPFPALGANTPVGNLPYGLGLAISASAFNQLLKAQVESGLLQQQITQLAGFDLTMGVLSVYIPEFRTLDASTPLILKLKPTMAPIITGNPGPGGELAELRVGQLIGTVVGPADVFGKEVVFVQVAFDARIGLDFTFENGALVPSFGTVVPEDIDVAITKNPFHASTNSLRNALPGLLVEALPGLGSALGSFPLPAFLGLQFQPVEVSRAGDFLGLFVNLQPAP